MLKQEDYLAIYPQVLPLDRPLSLEPKFQLPAPVYLDQVLNSHLPQQQPPPQAFSKVEVFSEETQVGLFLQVHLQVVLYSVKLLHYLEAKMLSSLHHPSLKPIRTIRKVMKKLMRKTLVKVMEVPLLIQAVKMLDSVILQTSH